MRAYFIRITNPDSGAVLADYTSFKPDGSTNGAALKVEFDIPLYSYADPAGNAYIKISGVSLADIQQSANFQDAEITIYGGMAKGLPLANPKQAGVLLKGIVYQCFGNWQGVNTSLEFMVIAKNATAAQPVNLAYTWTKGIALSDMVTQALKIAFPGATVAGGFSQSLVYTENQPFAYQTLEQFSRFVYDVSKTINPDPKYRGAQITSTPGGFYLFDGTEAPKLKPKEISFLDLIGQPTWLQPLIMQFKCVLRGDLAMGDVVAMPRGTNVINTTNGYSRWRNTTAFEGNFQINNIRHVGDSRQASADSWVTIVNAYPS